MYVNGVNLKFGWI